MFGSTQYHTRETIVVYGHGERILSILTLDAFGRTPAQCQSANRSPRLSLRIRKVSYHIDGIKRDQRQEISYCNKKVHSCEIV